VIAEKDGAVRVCGLTRVPVTSAEEVSELLTKAQERKQVAETKLNARSSRSHCMFTITVSTTQVELTNGREVTSEKVGKLHLVDLAGSENAKSAGILDASFVGKGDVVSGSSKARLREAQNINQSLLTLGRVITSLQNPKRDQRIPYRDSKLTRLLSDSLGGKCKSYLIATVSPSVLAIEESISTLKVGTHFTLSPYSIRCKLFLPISSVVNDYSMCHPLSMIPLSFPHSSKVCRAGAVG
jgi:kinesin family protein 11